MVRSNFMIKKELDNMKKIEEVREFKSYLRLLLRDLKDVKKAIEEKNNEVAGELVQNLIEDTQKDIEC